MITRHFLRVCLGNFFEHYDTALFGFLSLFLAPLIFPKEEPVTALILTYGMIPLGMIARPFGAYIFGFIGDRYGREQALFLTLSGMGAVSFGMAFSPTYEEAGVIAPLIFCLGRVLQNFLASGETMGGAIFLLEKTPKKEHDLVSALYSASSVGGILLASLGVSLIYHYEIVSLGWRALYLFGSITAFFGSLIRAQGERVIEKKKAPLRSLWEYKNEIFLIAIGAGFSYANYSVALLLMNGFIPLISNLKESAMVDLNTKLLCLDFCALPFFGWIASKISREKMMFLASLGVILSAIPLMNRLPLASFFEVCVIRGIFVLFGVAFFAPFHAFAQELVREGDRYRVISFAYAIGCQLFGGIAAPLSLFAFQKTGIVSSVAWYWSGLGLITFLGLSMNHYNKSKVLILKNK
jgi:hypothetical protein